jgi:putative transcriptional regulator
LGRSSSDVVGLKTGQILAAVPGMLDPNFDGTVVYLTSTEDGAAGVVLNRPTNITVASVLPEFAELASEPAVVFHGGPVADDHALVLGRRGLAIDMLDSVGEAPADEIRVFAGYAGWEADQLEREIAERAWFVLDGSTADVFSPDPTGLWRSVFGRQMGRLRRYQTYPDDLSLN